MHQDDSIDFQIAELIGKYLRDEISAEELAVLERWKSQDSRNLRLWKKLNDKQYISERLKTWPTDARSAALWKKMHVRSPNPLLFRWRIWRMGAVAAVIGVAVLFAVYTYYFSEASNEARQTAGEIAQIEMDVINGQTPGVSSAGVLLITDSGEQIALEGEQIQSRKLDDLEVKWEGKSLSYAVNEHRHHAAGVYHTIKTAFANIYQLELSDGTKVWLNASSSLRYPVAFERDERKVFLVGEAYFDVAKDANKPFTVVTDKSYIRVLGTEFNVRSYPGEVDDRTSLFTGSVNVQGKGDGAPSKLTPGYEAIVSGVKDIAIQRTSAYKVLAWKENLFIFENESLGDLMQELASWYGLEVHFEDTAAKAYRFTGRLKRYSDVNTLLDLISQTSKVTFRVNNGQVWIDNIGKRD